jgi:hypothetical protein
VPVPDTTPCRDDAIEARLMPDTVSASLVGRVACEGCGFAAIHDVLLSTIPRSIPDYGWFLVRECIQCGCSWAQPELSRTVRPLGKASGIGE